MTSNRLTEAYPSPFDGVCSACQWLATSHNNTEQPRSSVDINTEQQISTRGIDRNRARQSIWDTSPCTLQTTMADLNGACQKLDQHCHAGAPVDTCFHSLLCLGKQHLRRSLSVLDARVWPSVSSLESSMSPASIKLLSSSLKNSLGTSSMESTSCGPMTLSTLTHPHFWRKYHCPPIH